MCSTHEPAHTRTHRHRHRHGVIVLHQTLCIIDFRAHAIHRTNTHTQNRTQKKTRQTKSMADGDVHQQKHTHTHTQKRNEYILQRKQKSHHFGFTHTRCCCRARGHQIAMGIVGTHAYTHTHSQEIAVCAMRISITGDARLHDCI